MTDKVHFWMRSHQKDAQPQNALKQQTRGENDYLILLAHVGHESRSRAWC